eukprot:CAMPEP_0177555838 /NCGR_PEP_ID=MMETSP0369-20130122/68764_1 /TAXON_ID=447022 ORGANISM="Scrippsiella hangoei-like, Strain SHHI-4" /NCGR_SAMPLE_ID=MMETSP0369 /ASSEMBLY_ACC=CAM_ASM_000364 /LENGTH=63 /DNA_ID=CAMNT_0019042023 /DNA_START=42 /DNA_END=229 /DNA_ORIENTATION=-
MAVQVCAIGAEPQKASELGACPLAQCRHTPLRHAVARALQRNNIEIVLLQHRRVEPLHPGWTV